MYFIVAYYGCVGLIAALGEAGSISMRGGDGHNLQLETKFGLKFTIGQLNILKWIPRSFIIEIQLDI